MKGSVGNKSSSGSYCNLKANHFTQTAPGKMSERNNLAKMKQYYSDVWMLIDVEADLLCTPTSFTCDMYSADKRFRSEISYPVSCCLYTPICAESWGKNRGVEK